MCFAATYNVNRGKKRAINPIKKRTVRKADMEVVSDNLKTITEVEKAEGKGWVNLIYRKNGLKPPRKEGKNG